MGVTGTALLSLERLRARRAPAERTQRNQATPRAPRARRAIDACTLRGTQKFAGRVDSRSEVRPRAPTVPLAFMRCMDSRRARSAPSVATSRSVRRTCAIRVAQDTSALLNPRGRLRARREPTPSRVQVCARRASLVGTRGGSRPPMDVLRVLRDASSPPVVPPFAPFVLQVSIAPLVPSRRHHALPGITATTRLAAVSCALVDFSALEVPRFAPRALPASSSSRKALRRASTAQRARTAWDPE